MAALRFDEADIGVLAGFLLLFGVLAAMSVIDIECYRLPDRIVLPTLAVSLPLVVVVSVLADDASRIRYALAGGALYFGFLFVAHLISPRGMGFGDVKLAALMGLYVGWLGSDRRGHGPRAVGHADRLPARRRDRRGAGREPTAEPTLPVRALPRRRCGRCGAAQRGLVAG